MQQTCRLILFGIAHSDVCISMTHFINRHVFLHSSHRESHWSGDLYYSLRLSEVWCHDLFGISHDEVTYADLPGIPHTKDYNYAVLLPER